MTELGQLTCAVSPSGLRSA